MQYNPYLMANRQTFYRNSSAIVDLAIGQIPRSTQRISCYYYEIIHEVQIQKSTGYHRKAEHNCTLTVKHNMNK